MTLALLGGLDYERAEGNGVTAKRLKALKEEWVRICGHFGADSAPAVFTFDSINTYVAKRREDGLRGQSIVRDVQAIKRACATAEENGSLPYPPKLWPKVRRDPKNEKQRGKLHPTPILRAWFDALEPGECFDEARVVLLLGLRSEEKNRIQPSWVETFDGVGTFLHVPDWAAKDRDERFIFLEGEAREIIESYAEGKARDATVFSGADYKKQRKGACKRIGYPTVITLRDLRTTWSTIALQKTSDAAAVQASMGHEDLSTTQMYQKSTLGRQAAVSRSVAREIGTSRHSKVGTDPESAGRWSQEWELNPRPADYESAPALLALVTGLIYATSAARSRTELRLVVDGSRHTNPAQQRNSGKRGAS